MKSLTRHTINKLAAWCMFGAVYFSANATSFIIDPTYATSTALATSTPQDGQNITAIFDSVSFLFSVAPQTQLQMMKVDAVDTSGHHYVVTPVSAPVYQSGNAFDSSGIWNVVRDGTVVCKACQGAATLSAQGYWISVWIGERNSTAAWTLVLGASK